MAVGLYMFGLHVLKQIAFPRLREAAHLTNPGATELSHFARDRLD